MKLNRWMILGALIISPAFAATAIEKQCETNGINYQHAVSFVRSFKQSLQANDPKAVAGMADYPVMVNQTQRIQGKDQVKHVRIKNQAQLIKQYDVIFNRRFREKIIKDQSDLFCNYQGAMIADGAIWFNANEKSTGFFVVNK